MTPAKKTALTTIVTGLAFSATAFVVNAVLAPSPRIAQSLAFAISLGAAMTVYGAILLARAKGRPWYFGLLGLFSCVGVALLWFAVPDGVTHPVSNAP